MTYDIDFFTKESYIEEKASTASIDTIVIPFYFQFNSLYFYFTYDAWTIVNLV